MAYLLRLKIPLELGDSESDMRVAPHHACAVAGSIPARPITSIIMETNSEDIACDNEVVVDEETIFVIFEL